MNWNEYIAVEKQDHERVNFKMVYVDMAGDLMAGLLLSQIVYWNSPDKDVKERSK